MFLPNEYDPWEKKDVEEADFIRLGDTFDFHVTCFVFRTGERVENLYSTLKGNNINISGIRSSGFDSSEYKDYKFLSEFILFLIRIAVENRLHLGEKNIWYFKTDEKIFCWYGENSTYLELS
jgi:hypothetical protein